MPTMIFFGPERRPFVQEVVLPALTGEPARWEGELRFAESMRQAVRAAAGAQA